MDQLLTTDDLARILRKSVSSIRHDLSRNPRGLPPGVDIPGTLRRLWRPQDVEAWLASHVASPIPDAPQPVRRRRGAPTKAERLAKAGKK